MLLVLKIASCYIGLNGFSLMSPLKAYYLVGDCTSINTTSRKPVRYTRNISNLINLMLYNININKKTNEVKTTIKSLIEKSLRTIKL